MNSDISAFDSWCQACWGSTETSYEKLPERGTPQIRDNFEFDNISPSVKAHIAEKLIIESCGRIGAFQESGDVSWYIQSFARELRDNGRDFRGRRIQPLKAALLLVVYSWFSAAPPSTDDVHHILAGGGAMSAMYLLAQLEFLFRKKGRYLKEDGTIKRLIPAQLCKKASLSTNLKPNSKDRVNRIDQAFLLYLYRNRTLVGKRLRILDRRLRIANRLRRIRHPAMHGELPDPVAEARFFGLLVAMLYYGKG